MSCVGSAFKAVVVGVVVVARSVTVVTSQVAKPNWRWSGGSAGPGGNSARTDGRVFCMSRESEPGPSEANTSV